MPYHLHQGGRRRRRRRWPALVAVLALLGAGVAAGLTLAPERADEPARPAAPAIEEPLAGGGPAPLAGGGTAPSPLSVRLDDPRDVVRLRFKRRPRSGLLFDLDTGRVLWRHDPTRVLPIASLTKMMTALLVARRVPPGSKVRITREALRYRGLGRRPLPPRPPRRGRDDAARAPAPVRQRRGDRARPAHERQREALRGADEPARPGDGPGLHALLLSRRLRQPRQPLLHAGPRRARARGAARAAAGADRAPPPGRPAVPDQGRQDLPLQPQPAAAAGLPRRDRHQDGLHRPPPGAAWSRPRGAGGSASASCCCTRPTRAARRASCSSAASASRASRG